MYTLKNVKISKVSGVDNLPSALRKIGMEEIAHLLKVLANRFIQEYIFPSAEKSAKVIPLYKAGERYLFYN